MLVSLFGRSCRPRRGLEGTDGGKDLPEDVARYRHLCQLEGDLARMAYNPCSDLYEAALDTCQRPVRDFFGQIGTL